MLTKNKIQGFIPTQNYETAKVFYTQTLGLRVAGEDPFALELQAGDNRVRLVKVERFQPLPFTLLGWEVENIDAVAGQLKTRGVKFERWEWMPQDELGVWTSPSGARVAWFKDPDGNLLSISQHDG